MRRSTRGRPHPAVLAGATLFLLVLAAAARPLAAQDFPYQLTWERDGALLGTALGVGLLDDSYRPFGFEGEIAGLSADDVNAFDRWAVRRFSSGARTWSDVSRDALVLGAGVLLAAEVAQDREIFTLSVMTAEVAGLVWALTTRTKAWAERVRPYAFDESRPVGERAAFARNEGDVLESFFSGHTVTAFAAAAYASTLFGDLHGWDGRARTLRLAALGLAATTAAGRVLGGQHYPTDVLVGAGVGLLIGWGIPRLHRRGREGRVRAVGGGGGLGVRIGLRQPARHGNGYGR